MTGTAQLWPMHPRWTELAGQWVEPVRQYLHYLQVEKHYSSHTLQQYHDQLLRAAYQFSAQVGAWQQVSVEQVRGFSMHLRQQKRSPRTIAMALTALRNFYKYATLVLAFTDNPAQSVRPPKASQLLPKSLDADHMAQVLEVDPEDPLQCRDRAMLELMYSSGLRLSEVVGLNLPDLDLLQGQATVLGKGNKQRVVPIGQQATLWLNQWLAQRTLLVKTGEQAVFLSQQGTRLSPRQLRERVKQWGLRQGSAEHLHPHKFRHSCASHFLQSSGDLRAVQELLGHSSLAATQVYTHLDFQHLAKVYDQAHPRAKKS